MALLGITVLVLPGKRGRVDLKVALRELGRLEVTSVLVEGGGELLGSLFDAGLVDRAAFFYAPKVIAGSATVRVATQCRGAWRKVGEEVVFEGSVVKR